MKTIIALAFVLLAVPVQAQTATATWVQFNTLTEAQSFPYALKDGATSTPLSAVTCRVVSGVTECSAKVPLPSNGPHNFSIVSSNLAAAKPVLIGITAGAPYGYTVTVTVKYAAGG